MVFKEKVAASKGGRGTLLIATLLVLSSGLWDTTAALASPISFGADGYASGQFEEAGGAAVNQETGDVYVIDRNNNRIDEFSDSGAFVRAWGWGVSDGKTEALQTCVSTCFPGIVGAGSGQLNYPEGVAVNNDPLSGSHGDVYVIDERNLRIEQFDPQGAFIRTFGGGVNKTTGTANPNVCQAGEDCGYGAEGHGHGEFERPSGIAVDAGGSVYVGDSERVERFNADGVYESELALPGAGSTGALAVGAGEDLYVISGGANGVREYNFGTHALVGTLDESGRPESLALGSNGELFIEDDSQQRPYILVYDSSGSELALWPRPGAEDECHREETEGVADCLLAPRGIAVADMPSERLYELGKLAVWIGMPPVPGALVTSESGEPGVPASNATVNATVIPEGSETTCHFEYGPTSAYGKSTSAVTLPASFSPEAVTASLTGLQAGTTYHIRLVSTDAAGHTTAGSDATFTTYPPSLIESQSIEQVVANGATLVAKVDPLGNATTYKIEYRQGATVNVAAVGNAGSGTSGVPIEVKVRGLAAGTHYEYRLTATNVLGIASSVIPFTTESAGTEPSLPDGRFYEQVSPVEKHGAVFSPIYNEGAVIQAAAGGEAITYASFSSTEAEPQASPAPEWSQILSKRSTAGVWQSRDITTSREETSGLNPGNLSEYRLFSQDLSSALLEPLDPRLLSSYATERTPYMREDSACAPSTVECFVPLLTSAANHADVAPGTQFGGPDDGHGELRPLPVQYTGANADLSHIVLSSAIPLTIGSSEKGLYEWTGGDLQPVSVMPGGKAANAPCPSLGYDGSVDSGDVRNAVSANGQLIVWEAHGEEGGGGCNTEHHLYLRNTVFKETVQLDRPQSGAIGFEAESRPVYRTASVSDSTIFFTDIIPLTPDSTNTVRYPASADLYACEVSRYTSLECHLSDMTRPLGESERANVQGVFGASQDGSTVYVVAGGILSTRPNAAGEAAMRGQNNLYLVHRDAAGRWTPTFVTVLAATDSHDWSGGIDPGELSGGMTSRVSPNGRYAAFMSDRAFTSYDNRDISSHELDEEVYVYDAQTGLLTCASCNPTGAPPTGSLIEFDKMASPLVERTGVWRGRWVSGLVPGWTPNNLGAAVYQSRYLSDEGRLFFDSRDALVPQDTNGTWDVYEYEPTGVGDCTPNNATFSQTANGCVGLISSGTATEESAFLDASETGQDVFFLTSATLVRQDRDTALDVYDAHECDIATPCAGVPASLPPCDTTDACRKNPAQPTSVFGSPASSTFSGEGVLQSVAAPITKTKNLTPTRKRARGRNCRKRHGGKPRMICEQRPKKRNGIKGGHRGNRSGRGRR